jgi:methionyl-tRNA synthetase
MATVLYVTAEVVREIGILVQPVMPKSASALLDLVAAPADQRSFASLGEAGRLRSGTALPPAVPIFPRYQEKEAVAS